MPAPDPSPTETLGAYFSALTTGDVASIRSFLHEEADVRISPGEGQSEAGGFETALERHIHLTEDTEGFHIRHRSLQVEDGDDTAWFKGSQTWEVEWDGEVHRMSVEVSGVLERIDRSWKLVQMTAVGT